MYGSSQDICEAAIGALQDRGISVVARSRWFRTAPVPVSDQPWFVNGVIAVATGLRPADLLSILHEVEAEFGRTRNIRNEARILDLDLVAYDDLVTDGATPPALPHPRMHERAFVLLPLSDIAPDWKHPSTGISLPDLIAALPADQRAEPDA
ncbi:2-amino-4-hydroxy-6-hydroxymethyldihydropteridine diphosphokinase [Skermanella mucosa]|uniref:2-amino-4-hydroxy-6- hydroxymethyldihydropteridine diphosphokinase n=1 Tax=Skermanella mucosa TaxID=1789672 RepID=UPI002B21642A|nr:2-amino-4-hydroxy-6-hydroxymethyldihydropteridine diphosphokinase [Skermanella mucosa]